MENPQVVGKLKRLENLEVKGDLERMENLEIEGDLRMKVVLRKKLARGNLVSRRLRICRR